MMYMLLYVSNPQTNVFIWQLRYNSNTLNMGQLMHQGCSGLNLGAMAAMCIATAAILYAAYRDWKPWASSSFLASCSLTSSTCACSSPICSWRSDNSPSSLRLAFSSSCRPFSSFFSRSGG